MAKNKRKKPKKGARVKKANAVIHLAKKVTLTYFTAEPFLAHFGINGFGNGRAQQNPPPGIECFHSRSSSFTEIEIAVNIILDERHLILFQQSNQLFFAIVRDAAAKGIGKARYGQYRL